MYGFKLRVVLLYPLFAAVGFTIGLRLCPDYERGKLTFVHTYFFAGRDARSDLIRSGDAQPVPEGLGTSTTGPRAELAIPVNAKIDKDLELLIEYSLNPKLSERTVEVAVNGAKIAEWTLLRGKQRRARSLKVPSLLWDRDKPLSVTMTAKGTNPSQRPELGEQTPELGMILHAVSVYQES